MAMNPRPFTVDDSTDEDFFNKLVNDDEDVDFKVSTPISASGGPILTDGNESDEAKAFANLSINDLDENDEVNFGNTSDEIGVDESNANMGMTEHVSQVGKVEERGNSLVSSSSFEFDKVIQNPGNEGGGTEDGPDMIVVGKTMNEGLSDVNMLTKSSGGSGASGVKEVDWSAFHADAAQHGINGFGSYSDFFSEFEGDSGGDAFGNIAGDTSKNGLNDDTGNALHGSSFVDNSNNYGQYSEGYNDGIAGDQSSYMQDLNSSQCWESQYPGWNYDPSTGQWYQVDHYNEGESGQSNVGSSISSTYKVADGQSALSHMHQTPHSVAGAVAEASTTESVTNWNQVSQGSDPTEITTSSNQDSYGNNGYPSHIMFDPKYPGWYYDTIAQNWFTLESYAVSAPSIGQGQEQMNLDEYALTDAFARNNSPKAYGSRGQDNSYTSEGLDQNWAGSVRKHDQQSSTIWLPETVASREATSMYNVNQAIENHYGQNASLSNNGNHQTSVRFGVKSSYNENLSQGRSNFSVPSQFGQHFNDAIINQNGQTHVPNNFYSNQNPVSSSQQQIQNAQTSYTHASGRSSAGRPAHALVGFGFGGKLIVMKHNYNANFNFGSQNPVGGLISIINLAEVVNSNVNTPNYGTSISNYFQALCQQSVPGPLVGGNVGAKEFNKWIDERITNLKSADMDHNRAEALSLLLSLLKIACQYYGKLRSPYGTDAALKETDSPESTVAKLFAAARSRSQFSQYDAVAQCLLQLPSEGQLRITAAKVQSLLVSGKKKEALQCAQEGQLWGPALVLAAQLGDQFYVETVKQMALCHLVPGSPLRTLCLLIAGQAADVFSTGSTAVGSMTGDVNMSQQPGQFGSSAMLDDWEENLAVMTANRTKDDELVLIHLGDGLWKERSDIIAAHICYLVAEASFEPYSDRARLCLVGADHWRFPRTYASPEAIQRTEIYEYSKMLGNSQFVLLPFQPYKFVYALMLAEVGRISEALKYCRVVLKSLKTGRTAEVETLRHLVSSLEERIKAHQQGGFSANLAPKELIGKLINLFDSTAHRVVGGLPPSVPTTGGTVLGKQNHYQSIGPRVSTSQSTMAMSSLAPSQSMEPITEWAADSNRMAMHTRSVSEPDFGRSPKGQADTLVEAGSSGVQDKAPAASSTSRFGRFGFGSQLLQKTVGLVLKPRQGRQAKLGETNKFYYDEKLKRWVEEGAEPPAEEAALPPPPTTVFQNGTSEYSIRSALQSEAYHNIPSQEYKSPSAVDNSPGIPPLPPMTNQYSARGRMGVRSRYVDTFNQGGGSATSSFQSPPVPSIKPASGANPKFFVPAPVSNAEQAVDTSLGNNKQYTSSCEDPSIAPLNDSSFQPPAPPSTINMQRYASMNNISKQGTNDSGSFSVHSRRAASWSGSFNDSFSPPSERAQGGKPLGDVLAMQPMQPSSFMTSDPSSVHSSMNGGSFGDDLHEVEL
ncbi:hypothetical protein OROMI_020761 [Orobanche minor]